MSEQGPDGPRTSSNDARPQPPAAAGSTRRLGNPTRLIPRRTPPPAPTEPIERDPLGFEAESDPTLMPNDMSDFYPAGAPQPVTRGQVRVLGFGPGCLIASLVISVVLTLLLNILF